MNPVTFALRFGASHAYLIDDPERVRPAVPSVLRAVERSGLPNRLAADAAEIDVIIYSFDGTVRHRSQVIAVELLERQAHAFFAPISSSVDPVISPEPDFGV